MRTLKLSEKQYAFLYDVLKCATRDVLESPDDTDVTRAEYRSFLDYVQDAPKAPTVGWTVGPARAKHLRLAVVFEEVRLAHAERLDWRDKILVFATRNDAVTAWTEWDGGRDANYVFYGSPQYRRVVRTGGSNA